MSVLTLHLPCCLSCRAVVYSNTFVSIDISVYCDVLLLRECGVNVDTFNTDNLEEIACLETTYPSTVQNGLAKRLSNETAGTSTILRRMARSSLLVGNVSGGNTVCIEDNQGFG